MTRPPATAPDPLGRLVDGDALARCAQEPIAVPGAIQPHGALLAVTEPDLAVVVASANAADVLGTDPSGATLADLLTPAELDRLRAALAGDLAEADPLQVTVGGREADLVLSRSGGLLVTEWEPVAGAGQAGAAWHRRLPRVLQRLSAPTRLEGLTGVLAREVRALTGFDRVMVYRFDADWNGEVVAEDRRADLEPFLGLHYPAGDIPAQARALYATNWLRLIPDAGYTPVPLVPPVVPGTGAPLDLSGAVLRSVSPVHLEYLANMGVTASMSVSLIDRGTLWGLVACHSYSGPHRPSYADRTAAEFLGRTASLLLHTAVEAADRDAVVAVARREADLAGAVGRSPRAPAAALVDGEVTALDLLPAAGAAVRLDGRLHLLGTTPPADRVAALVPAVLRAGGATDRLTLDLPGFTDLAADASGVLAVEVGGGRGDYLAWFRPETPREVSWGGDPRTSKVTDGRLSPRRSFDRWTETVRGTARPWRGHEVAAARSLARHLGEAVLARAGEDDRLATALQRTLLLEELPKVPGVALGARYRPSEADVVGGDWYDLVPLPSGRLAVVLGDVAGHGLSAASVTAQLRHALRAALLRDEGPAAALAELNRLVTTLLPGEMATAVVARLDPASGELALASAGHLPAVHAAGGSAELVGDGRGPALGLLDDADYPQARLWLGAGERLLLYSDGLVERRDRPLPDRLEALRHAALAAEGGPQEVVDAVVATLDPAGTDDVTVVGLARV
ncbi:Bacteriophytochrome (light-regulated signal transduction histidine kinase) [Geodermatophilus saharensis]|uniref:Bacteriophytochrome (Light-regulated signal transduction histidine kinase) n=1 Tax=Geodermatophilus saharensis TaxID=1137994 RepID=A0A239ECM2_9ACTN|nr:SpoIIE family protein phosphatase [Geodermatophilus saharensis]SNS42201.1 Bacteriophytochrome (light-regulated signal transduction histidine kinase) [Geodermatophilus saharensis]